MKKNLGSDVSDDHVWAVIDNLVRLEIFYKEFNYEEITETPSYPVHSVA